MFHLVLITQPSEHGTQPETQRVRGTSHQKMQIHTYESVVIMNEAHLHRGDAIITLVAWRNPSVFLWVSSEPQGVRIMMLLFCIRWVSFCLFLTSEMRRN